MARGQATQDMEGFPRLALARAGTAGKTSVELARYGKTRQATSIYSKCCENFLLACGGQIG